ncbi:UPF0262 family protein [Palleronia sediminis]|uniref:UPF0262 family protein n=1 Tax=Palleronia sediminis TaxID=2547833 RepID=UPI0014556926|nr:UPF0262 family protein [Palleronia sediminis]
MSGPRLISVALASAPEVPPETEQDRRVAIFDLEEHNSFALAAEPSLTPLRLTLSADRDAVTFAVADESGTPRAAFAIPRARIDAMARDYRDLCRAYASAVKSLPPARIAALDAARRALHDRAGADLQKRLAAHAILDPQTARRLFTLIATLDP